MSDEIVEEAKYWLLKEEHENECWKCKMLVFDQKRHTHWCALMNYKQIRNPTEEGCNYSSK